MYAQYSYLKISEAIQFTSVIDADYSCFILLATYDLQFFLLNLLIKCSPAQLMELNFIVQALHTSLVLINDVLQAFILHLKIALGNISVIQDVESTCSSISRKKPY